MTLFNLHHYMDSMIIFQKISYKILKYHDFVGKNNQIFCKSLSKTIRPRLFKQKNTYKNRILRVFVGKIKFYIIKNFLQKPPFLPFCRKKQISVKKELPLRSGHKIMLRAAPLVVQARPNLRNYFVPYAHFRTFLRPCRLIVVELIKLYIRIISYQGKKIRDVADN